jgi:hypothetical protein
MSSCLDSSTTPGTSNSCCLEADHSMQMLAWSILGNVAVSVGQPVPVLVDAGLLQLLVDVVAFGVSGTCSDAASAAWFGCLTPEQLSASQQLAWSTLQEVRGDGLACMLQSKELRCTCLRAALCSSGCDTQSHVSQGTQQHDLLPHVWWAAQDTCTHWPAFAAAGGALLQG